MIRFTFLSFPFSYHYVKTSGLNITELLPQCHFSPFNAQCMLLPREIYCLHAFYALRSRYRWHAVPVFALVLQFHFVYKALKSGVQSQTPTKSVSNTKICRLECHTSSNYRQMLAGPASSTVHNAKYLLCTEASAVLVRSLCGLWFMSVISRIYFLNLINSSLLF